MRFRNIVGPQIRRLRYNRKWSQSKLALKLQLAGWDISRSSLAKIEAQLVWVSDSELWFFARVLRVNLPDLYPNLESRRRVDDTLNQLLKGKGVPRSGAQSKTSALKLHQSSRDAETKASGRLRY